MDYHKDKMVKVMNAPPWQTDVTSWFQQATTYIQNGQLDVAEIYIKRILSLHPEHAGANHCMGLIASQRREYDLACQLISRAIKSNPDEPLFHLHLGIALQMGGHFEDALASFDRTIQLKPMLVDAHIGRGYILRGLGRLEEALAAYDKATLINPESADTHRSRGDMLSGMGRMEEALIAYRQAIQINPEDSNTHCNCGVALSMLGRMEDALVSYRKAIRINPAFVRAYNNYGNALRALHRLEESLAAFEQALHISPQCGETHRNRGAALDALGRAEEALIAYEQAIRINPEDAKAHHFYAMSLLLMGDFQRGWKEYEWRWKDKDYTTPHRNFNRPLWNGESLHGKTILLHAEQGLGDTLQFIRYVSYVAQAGGRIVVECQKACIKLLSDIEEIDLLVQQGEPLPAFDAHAPLLSLPGILGTTLDTIPGATPYLSAPPLSSSLIEQFRMNTKDIRIGIVWAGNPEHINDRNRSIELTWFHSLLAVPNTRWYSLQVGNRHADLGKTEGFDVTEDTSPYLTDFSVTATVINQLDLVISVDTSVAHLAGALGKPVWVLLPYNREWRWLLNRDDSPWYPDMRLFRQQTRGSWQGVFEEVGNALMELDID